MIGSVCAAADDLKGLGSTVFKDVRLSADGTVSCSTCHQPGKYFQDGLPLSKGVRGQLGTRNAPSILNASFNTSQFWDGRRATLEEQAQDPLLNPREHGMADEAAVLAVIRRDPAYVEAFMRLFHRRSAEDIRLQDVTAAIAAYERTLVVDNSPYDRFVAGDKAALGASAQRGLALFAGRAQCGSCHSMEAPRALFADNQFHSLSVGLKKIEGRLADITTRLVALRQKGETVDHAVLSDEDIAELGRFAVTLKPVDIGRFRTPSLRNVAMTAPYMHDGSVATLEEAVDIEIYYRSTEAGRPLILTPVEKADLVEFLRALTSPLPDVLAKAGVAAGH